MRYIVSIIELFGALHSINNRNVSLQLNDLTIVAILIWRALLCLLHLNETGFARTLDSFRTDIATVSLQYDAR